MVKHIFWSTKFLVKEFLLKKVFGSFGSKNIVFKKNQEELTPGTGYMPPLKTVGLKLCWVVVSFVRSGRMQNFRPVGPLFLVEVEFPSVGWVVNSNNHVKPNSVELSLGCVEVVTIARNLSLPCCQTRKGRVY